MGLLRKLMIMALLGAVGAAVGAAAGEPLFGEPVEVRTQPRRICLLFDVSGSMGDRIAREARAITQLQALKEAASDFVRRQDLGLDSIGLAVFASDAHVVQRLGHNPEVLYGAIRNLTSSGGTNLGRGFEAAGMMLRHEPGERWVLVFTDGKPETSSTHETPEAAALSAASRLREAGVNIVAIGTGLADARLLEEAAGSPDNVIISDPRRLHEAFQRSEEVINNRQMLASQAAPAGFRRNVVVTGSWAALIAIGAALGLVIGQNRHMRRRHLLRARDVVVVVTGGVLTGLVSGAVGQSLFYVLSEVPAIAHIGRTVAWTLLGCGIGFGMGSFVPNLNRQRASVAGAAGGLVAGCAFIGLAPAVGDMSGRLLGAAILGLSTGFMMVLVEAAMRASFLTVHWSESERSTVSLGSKPVLVGSSSDAHVLIAEDDSPAPVVARIWQADDDAVYMKDREGNVTTLPVGHVLAFGRTRVEVCGEAAAPARRAA